jgi:hypothetical protein
MKDSLQAIEIPSAFFQTRYNGDQHPGVAIGLANGANCQHFWIIRQSRAVVLEKVDMASSHGVTQ